MRTTLRKVRSKRHFSEEFKRSIVSSYEKGEFSAIELGKLYQIDFRSIYDWIYKYSTFNRKSIQVVEMKSSHTKKLKELEQRVKELERTVGIKQLHIDYLEKIT